MDAGVHPKHHFAHHLHQGGKHELAGILSLCGAGEEVVEAWRIQEPL